MGCNYEKMVAEIKGYLKDNDIEHIIGIDKLAGEVLKMDDNEWKNVVSSDYVYTVEEEIAHLKNTKTIQKKVTQKSQQTTIVTDSGYRINGVAHKMLGGIKLFTGSGRGVTEINTGFIIPNTTGASTEAKFISAIKILDSKLNDKVRKTISEGTLNKDANIMLQREGTGVKGFSEKLNKKLQGILKKLYPKIKLEYTTEQILYGEGVMNQEEVNNTVKLGMKVVSALHDLGTAKPSKHGGKSAPVLETIRVKQEIGVRERLAAKGVMKEQVDFVFEYMKQNDIAEIKTSELAERVLFALTAAAEVNVRSDTTSNAEYENSIAELESIQDDIPSEAYSNYLQEIEGKKTTRVPTSSYADLTVPGGTKMLQQSGGEIKGQANIKAKTVLINSLLQSQDTLPHEYAHHYIAMFRDAPIVQSAIKRWGNEEKLVQAIGEQSVKQEGKAWDWYKNFTKWLRNKFSKLSDFDKEELKNILTDAFLENKDLSDKGTEPVVKKKNGTMSVKEREELSTSAFESIDKCKE